MCEREREPWERVRDLKLVRVCGWCRRTWLDGDWRRESVEGPTTHGICPPCAKAWLKGAAVLGALLVTCCDPVDADWLRSQVTGEPLRPLVLPWEVVLDPDYEVADGAVVEDATGLWQGWARRDGVPRDWFERARPLEPEPRGLGQVWVTRDFLPSDVAAQATLDENSLGEIRWAVVRLAWDWTWAEHDVRVAWMAHELGHCLGLADDPRDLDESVMASPTRVGSRLTDHDFALLTGGEP